jgi:hypothetical protein
MYLRRKQITVPAMLDEFLREFHAASPDERAAVAQKYGLTFFPAKPGKPLGLLP